MTNIYDTTTSISTVGIAGASSAGINNTIYVPSNQINGQIGGVTYGYTGTPYPYFSTDAYKNELGVIDNHDGTITTSLPLSFSIVSSDLENGQGYMITLEELLLKANIRFSKSGNSLTMHSVVWDIIKLCQQLQADSDNGLDLVLFVRKAAQSALKNTKK